MIALMCRLVRLLALFLALTAPGSLLAGGDGPGQAPATAYPVAFVHGPLGYERRYPHTIASARYWSHLPHRLAARGFRVYSPRYDLTLIRSERSREIRHQLLLYLAATGSSRMHVVAHSVAGLDLRYVISHLGMSQRIASLSTINTPHLGSPVALAAREQTPEWLSGDASIVHAVWARLLPTWSDQRARALLAPLTPAHLSRFNEMTPDGSETSYYSYGSYITLPDPIQHTSWQRLHPIVWKGARALDLERENDGFVPISSQHWGEFRGGPRYPFFVRGLDHSQVANALYLTGGLYDDEGYYLNVINHAIESQ